MFINKNSGQMSMMSPSEITKILLALIAISLFFSGCGINGNGDKADSGYYHSGMLVNAVAAQDLATVEKILQQANYNVNEVNEENQNAIFFATYLNNFEIARKLIDAGANINIQDKMNDSAYLYAAAEGRTEILRYMLMHAKPQPDQNVYNRFGNNAIILATEKGHIENIRLLLETEHVDINRQNSFGYTALIEAIALKDGSLHYQGIVKLLLDAGAKTDLRDKTGRTALDYAEEKGYQRMLEMLNEAAKKREDTKDETSENDMTR